MVDCTEEMALGVRILQKWELQVEGTVQKIQRAGIWVTGQQTGSRA